jgi:hypothetical protein
MTTTEKMVTLEFYLLGDDHTWDTDFIEVPASLWAKHIVDNNNPTPVVDWVNSNVKFKDGICLIGVYCDHPLEMQEEV